MMLWCDIPVWGMIEDGLEMMVKGAQGAVG